MDMPYGYYQFVRFAGMIGFIILAFLKSQNSNNFAVFIYISLAILFQPFYKIALGRELWNLVDVFIGLGLLLSIYINPELIKDNISKNTKSKT
jgi:hypothetical protein